MEAATKPDVRTRMVLQQTEGREVQQTGSGSLSEADKELLLVPYIRRCITVQTGQPCGRVSKLLQENADQECIVVCDENGVPEGLVMRQSFFRMMGKRYGTDLYGERPVSMIMQTSPFAVEYDIVPGDLIEQALGRTSSICTIVSL